METLTEEDSLIPAKVVPLKLLPDTTSRKSVPPEIVALRSEPQAIQSSFYVSMDNYTTEQGLSMDAISSSCVDQFGTLWFGTFGGGVMKFDGQKFIQYTSEHGLANNIVWDIMEDQQGNIWFGTDGGGLSKFDGRGFTNYTTENGLNSNIIYSIFEDNTGNIWIGTKSGGVNKFDGQNFIDFNEKIGIVNSSLTIYSILQDTEKNMWFGTERKGLIKYNGQAVEDFPIKKNAKISVKTMALDKTGNIWLGTTKGELYIYTDEQFKLIDTVENLKNTIVQSMHLDSENNLWLGTEGNGLVLFDGKKYTSFTTDQGLSNNSIITIVEDNIGNLWFGTDGGGIDKYTGKSFTNFFTQQGLSNDLIWSIAEDKDGNHWFGTDGGGANKYTGSHFIHYTVEQGLPSNTIWCIKEDSKGNVWFGTRGRGACKFDGNSFTNYTSSQGLGSNYIYSIYEDSKGRIWFGTHGGGVSVLNDGQIKTYTTENGLSNNIVRAILEDNNGNMWFGTQGGGLSMYNGEKFVNYSTEQGLGNDIVLSLAEDRSGNIWIGTYNSGVSRFDGESFLSFDKSDGLPDNTVTQVVVSKDEDIIVGTNTGIAVLHSLSPQSILSTTEKKYPIVSTLSNSFLKDYVPNLQIYNTSTGYLVKDVNTGQNCIFEDSKGVIWIGTGSDKSGLVKFDPSGIKHKNTPPETFITSVKLNGEDISWYNLSMSNEFKDTNLISYITTEEIITFGRTLTVPERQNFRDKYKNVSFDSISRFYPLPLGLTLPYLHNNITFEFNAVAPSNHELLNFRYKLEGYDKSWSPISKSTTASFGNISEGIYTFKLKVQSAEGVWSEPITFSFEVLPPWYRTWWAYTLYFVFVFLLLYLIYRFRTASLRKDKEILEKTVKERTSEVVLQKELAESQKVLVEQKNREITDSINYALRIQNAILPKMDAIESYFPSSFIYFKAKDIVSGDFYFFYKKKIKGKDLLFIAAADCTGHGVPGALMSMVGFERLTDAVEKSNDTSEILSLLNRGVKSSLHQSNEEESTRDGMDIAICAIDIENKHLQFSGANRPLWIIRNGGKEVEVYKGTRAAIGGYTDDDHQFETHQLKLNEGDTFYIFSDGYPDLFSSKGKKLTIKKFRKLILKMQKIDSMKEQKQQLESYSQEWMSGEKQIDDILIIGIRI